MAQPVWVLSVDLQTKTATFQSGMADAAKAARGSFTDIKAGAEEMGRSVGGSVTEARHGVMLLGEEFGVHLPRALTSFIASIGPVGAAMEAAFPFLAIAVGATLLIEHLVKLHEAGEKLTESQVNFGTTVSNVLNGLNEKLLQAGIRADELNHNHLGALNKQLEMIDRQSMNELVQSFGVVSKAADVTFAQLKTSWYQWGAGSAGAKNALEQFKTQYDSLLAQGKDKEANDLLAGTKASAERVLDLQKQVKDNQTRTGTNGTHHGDYNKFEEAKIALQKQGLGYTDKEVEAQQTLVDALRAQASVQAKVAELKAAQSNNAVQSTQDKIDVDGDKAAREQAASQRHEIELAQKMWEENYKTAVAALRENERLKIDATEQGSAARLSAIDAAIKEENGKGLQETGFYKSLLTARVDTTRQMGKAEGDEKQRLADEELQLELSKGTRTEQAAKAFAEHQLSIHKLNADQEEQQEIESQKILLASDISALDRRIDALDKSDEKYLTKLREFENKKKELTQQSENEVTRIQQAAETRRVSVVTEAYSRMGEAAASTAARSIVQGKNLEQAFAQMGNSMLQTALQNLLQLETVQGRKRFGDARTAAADAFASAGNPILGAIEAAVAFSAVMAFDKGGIVPGMSVGDTVPAMLTPGEAVLPKRMTENLQYAAKFGSGEGGGDVHIHHHQTNHIHALDADGVHQMLREHGDKFSHHAVNTLRKMNR